MFFQISHTVQILETSSILSKIIWGVLPEKSNIFLDELKGIFERYFLYWVVVLAQQWLKFLDHCYFFDISNILNDAFENLYELLGKEPLRKNNFLTPAKYENDQLKERFHNSDDHKKDKAYVNVKIRLKNYLKI